MRKLKLYIACSLDGKIARPDGSIDWLPDPEENDYGYKAFYDSLDALVMGYKTYEITKNFGEWGFKGKESYVFSRNRSRELVPEAKLVNSDPVAFTQILKAEDGKDIWLLGGGSINAQLHDAGLIDEYIIAIVPVLLGEGIALFPGISREVKLKLDKQRAYDNGLVHLYYTPAV